LIDRNSAVDALVQSSRDRGMVRGLSTATCRMDYVAKSAEVHEGDLIVTSGLEGVFPKGVPIGRVLSVDQTPGSLFKEIIIQPEVDFSKLEEVLVIKKSREEEASTLLDEIRKH